MSDSLLGVLKFALLALLYLFFARVLWAVWSEVRGPRPGMATPPQPAGAAAPTSDPTAAAPAPAGKQRRKRGAVTKLEV
ncbi:MAG: hypothetical protein WCP59_15420, partial [Actinomycetota bacterium]